MFFDALAMGAKYLGDKAQNKAQKKLQAYKNKMTNIANSINQNTITSNTTLAIQQSAKQAVFMRKDELSSLGASAVSAAAAGVRGKSVNASLIKVKQNAAGLEKQRADDLQGYFYQATNQRLSSSLSAVQNQDLSYLPKPKLAGYLLDFAVQQGNKAMAAGG